MNAISKAMENTYSLLAILTMMLGVVVAAMFLISLVLGGAKGESLAVYAGSVMNWGIRIAAVATLFGILKIYFSREHSLTMDVDQGADTKNKATPERPA